jgi:ABC-type uncharacterized transport system ATPase subunit
MNEERKIIIEKKQSKVKSKRQMVELDVDLHEKLWKLSVETNRSLREIVDVLLRDALKYVEIQEGEENANK